DSANSIALMEFYFLADHHGDVVKSSAAWLEVPAIHTARVMLLAAIVVTSMLRFNEADIPAVPYQLWRRGGSAVAGILTSRWQCDNRPIAGPDNHRDRRRVGGSRVSTGLGGNCSLRG
ncbi:MAG: hypothetical protein WB020_09475, partial [Candidatus Dormiibacterota bacterium]